MNCRSSISSLRNTTLPGAVAMFSPTLNGVKSVWLIDSWPPPRSRSAAKFSMPLTRLSPLVAITSRIAAGLEIRKFDGEKASVSAFMKNSTRRLAIGSTSSTPATRSFSQLDVSR